MSASAPAAPDHSTIGLCLSGGGFRASFTRSESSDTSRRQDCSIASSPSPRCPGARSQPPRSATSGLGSKRLAFPKRAPKTLSLVDGGVYDNLGLEWFQGWTEDAIRPKSATKPAFTIVANASGLLEEKDKRFRPIPAFSRDLSIQYQQSLNLRVRWNREKLRASPGTGVYMAIKSDPQTEEGLDPALTAATLPTELVGPLASLRTDLDRFSEEEASLLSYHAYWTLHARLSVYADDLAMENPSWRDYVDLSKAEIERLRVILELGAHRFFRRVRRLLPRSS